MITLVVLNGRILAEGADYDYTLSGDPAEPVFNYPIPRGAVVQIIQFDGGASERHDVYDPEATEQGVVELLPTPGEETRVKPQLEAADFTLTKRT